MEVPAKFKSVVAGFRYWLLTLIFMATAAFLVSCGGSDTTITITDSNVPVVTNVSSIILTIADDPLVAGGLSTTTVMAQVFNFDGDPVLDGTTVNFVVDPIGTIPATATTKNGIAQVILTSDTTVGQYYITATAGNASQIAFGEFIAGPAAVLNTTLSANPNSIEADGVSTSLITLVAQDADNNPVSDATPVNFYTDDGTLSSSTGTTSNGIATVTLTSSTNDNTVATVTAIVGPVNIEAQVGFGAVVIIGGEGSGTANTIEVEIATNTIRVKNSGGNETTVIKATAKDETGAPVTNCDPDNNIRFEIVNGPDGGEKLDGGGLSVEKFTVNGVATATLSSGIVSGTVNIQVSVILNGDCTAIDPAIPAEGYYATAFSSQIAIEAGEPANIIIFQDNLVEANDDGSISQTFSALVQDLHGNPAENGTVVFFGLVDNPDLAGPPYLGYKSSGINGTTTVSTSSFTSAGNSFIADGLMDDDILIIMEGQDRGGHRIASVVSPTQLTLYNTMNDSVTGLLDFVAGSAELGTVCGSVQTGNLEMVDSSCTPTTVGGPGSLKGVAHTKLTWVPQGIFKPFNLYAESVGGDVGDTLADAYPAVAPVSVTVTISPSSVVSGTSGISVVAGFKDGVGNPIQGETVDFSSSNPGVAFIGGAVSVVTDASGKAATSIDTVSCLAANASVTITAALGSFADTASLAVSGTAPTANFTSTSATLAAAFADTSITPSGTNLTAWSWVFNGGNPATDITPTPPIVTYGLAGIYGTILTVTNDLGCSSKPVSKAVIIIIP